ncbi:hypothetical protein [Thalassotalea ganghwensis]
MHFSYKLSFYSYTLVALLFAIALSGIDTPLFYFFCGATVVAAFIDFVNAIKQNEISLFIRNENSLLIKKNKSTWLNIKSPYEIEANEKLFFYKITLKTETDVYTYSFFIRPQFNMSLEEFITGDNSGMNFS